MFVAEGRPLGQSASGPVTWNFNLLAHHELNGFGGMGEGMSIQIAPDGRRILWLAHESAPKNFTGIDVSDPRDPKIVVQTDLPHRKMRSTFPLISHGMTDALRSLGGTALAVRAQPMTCRRTFNEPARACRPAHGTQSARSRRRSGPASLTRTSAGTRAALEWPIGYRPAKESPRQSGTRRTYEKARRRSHCCGSSSWDGAHGHGPEQDRLI